jgi:hypothetical protein
MDDLLRTRKASRTMQKTLTQKLTLTGTGILAVFALAACGSTGDSDAGDSIELQPADQSTSAPAQSTATDDRDDREDTSSAGSSADSSRDRDDDRDDRDDDQDDDDDRDDSSSSGSGSSAGGSDPAFDAIDAVKGAAAGATVISLDRDDDDTLWDVTVVDGEETVEYDVTEDGQVTETERETDRDDVDEAGRAEVAIADAITAALEGRDGQTVDDVDLDEEDGTLVWKVDFDDADGNDADEVHVDAVTGDIVKG